MRIGSAWAKMAANVAAIAVLSSCVTTTTIRSEPSGADVLEGGQRLGRTPYSYSSQQYVFESRTVQVRAPGYEVATITLRRTELNTTQAILSAVVFFLLCWPAGGAMFLAGGMDLPARTSVQLTPLRGSSTSPPQGFDDDAPPPPAGFAY